MPAAPHYTFGDNPTAAARLGLVADAYHATSLAFLREVGRERVGVAADLGAGTGRSTALLHAAVGAPLTIGLERSPVYLEAAARLSRPGLRFVAHDVATAPFPVPPVGLLYGRLILTHLPEPAAALACWAEATVPDGRLALEEMHTLAADDPVLARYYALVEALQAAHGQRMQVGRDLPALVEGTAWVPERLIERPLPLPAATAARLHRLNLQTWRRDPFVAANVPMRELDALDEGLKALVEGRAGAPVCWVLAQAVFRRR